MIERSEHLNATAGAYDAIARLYAEIAADYLDPLPLDRAVLAAFAEYVRGEDTESTPRTDASPATGHVAELGCGPGYVTAHLAKLGLDVFGVDLSPVMIELARETYPELRFELGSMDALDIPDGSLQGVVAWYSIIHAPPQDVPAYIAEFNRVLAPGGHLLLGFFESGGDPLTQFDHRVAPAYRWPIDDLARLAKETGFAEIGRMLREPGEGERFRRGHLLMRRAT